MNPSKLLNTHQVAPESSRITQNFQHIHLRSHTHSSVERENTRKGSTTPEIQNHIHHDPHCDLTGQLGRSCLLLLLLWPCLFNANTGPHATCFPRSLVNSNNPEKLVLLLFYLADGTTKAQRNQVICPRLHSCLKTIKLLQMKCGYSLVHTFSTSIS